MRIFTDNNKGHFSLYWKDLFSPEKSFLSIYWKKVPFTILYLKHFFSIRYIRDNPSGHRNVKDLWHGTVARASLKSFHSSFSELIEFHNSIRNLISCGARMQEINKVLKIQKLLNMKTSVTSNFVIFTVNHLALIGLFT